MARSTNTGASSAGSTTAQETPLGEAGKRTAETASDLAERATNTGIQQIDRGREQAADTLSQFASSMRRTATDMPEQPEIVQTVTDALSEQTDRFANYLRETDARQMIHNVEDIARRQPLLFLGGAFVAGMLGARFIKVMTDGGGTQQSSSRRAIGSDRMPVPMGATEV
jgi:hypothetical protein